MTARPDFIQVGGAKSLLQLFLPHSSPYGLSFREWTVRWWEWCLSQPESTNPVNDRDGATKNASNNQYYHEAWFLAGTTGGFAERRCALPEHRSILCPIINFIISKAEEPTLQTDKELMDYARRDVDKIEKVSVNIDGIELPDMKKFRIESGPFDLMLPNGNICGVKGGPTRAAADGYWLFIRSLPPGDHQIQFGGSCLSGTINIGTAYQLSVK